MATREPPADPASRAPTPGPGGPWKRSLEKLETDAAELRAKVEAMGLKLEQCGELEERIKTLEGFAANVRVLIEGLQKRADKPLARLLGLK